MMIRYSAKGAHTIRLGLCVWSVQRKPVDVVTRAKSARIDVRCERYYYADASGLNTIMPCSRVSSEQ